MNKSYFLIICLLLTSFTGCIDDSELEPVENIDEIKDESDNTIDDTNNTVDETNNTVDETNNTVDETNNTVDETNTTEVPESNFTFEILSEHPFECMNNNVFDKFINVFGVYVVGTPGASLEYFNHTAHVTAQYIDNDEDGVADDPEVLKFLVDNNFVVPVWSEDDSEDFWDSIRGTYCEDNIGMAASMYYEYDEWALGGIEEAGTWDTNLEEVWHIISVGWYQTYPEFMGVEFEGNGDVIPSNLTEAMDAARGGQFMSIPDEYPEEAWYAYYDDTCDYHCQAHEYFYWILMANIGALDASLTDKCEDSKDEWYVCTKADLETVDVLAFDLLNNPIFNLPTIIPDGSYMDFNQNTNSPPTVSGVVITPNQASEGDILTCSYTFTDPDSDPDSSVFSWFVNGQTSEGHNSDTFSSDFVSGDSVSCSVTAYDGNEPGNTAESEAITISDD